MGLALLLAPALVGGCNHAVQLDVPPPESDRTVTQLFPTKANRDLDLLFMIDDSASMNPLQQKLSATLPTFAGQLASLPGGLPNLHIAVVSSSLGAGPTMGTFSCPVGGDGGRFQTMPRVPGCMTGLPAGATFLSVVEGKANFVGDLAGALSCIAALGDRGCGWEHTFASILKALEQPGQPTTNANFLRPSAYLGIVLLTNEDDCSAPPDSKLFDPTSQLTSDPLGVFTSFRCNEFGHLCGGKKPPRSPELLDSCTSAEDGTLLKVSEMIQRTKALKGGDASKILVSAIAGPITPYEVIQAEGTTMMGVTELQPSIKPSCTVPSGGGTAVKGDPAIRIKMWVDAFNGTFTSICDQTFESALTQIVNAVGAPVATMCVDGKLVDADLSAPGVQPSCVINEVTTNAQGNPSRTTLLSCATPGATLPCWTIATDAQACPGLAGAGRSELKIKRAISTPEGAAIESSCSICGSSSGTDGCRY